MRLSYPAAMARLFTGLLILTALNLGAVQRAEAAEFEPIGGQVVFSSTPLCAMVLANGQSTFSCSGDGSFALSVPLDGNGMVTLQVFASGFAPFRQTMTPAQLGNFTVSMIRSDSERQPTVTTDVSANIPGRSLISGTISEGSTPICALVLANGQSMFSCNANLGTFNLDVPLDGKGEITLQIFVAGFQPFRSTLAGDDAADHTNANLSGLSLSAGSLDQTFQSNQTSYTASVSFITSSVRVTPTPADPVASITVNGQPLPASGTSNAIALTSGANNILVKVTAGNGMAARTYTISVTRQTAGAFAQQAYVKASNTGDEDRFDAVAISGNTLVVGARGENGVSTGINGDQSSGRSTQNSGAVYVFTRTNDVWSQQAYIKASNAEGNDSFGAAVALSGNTLAVGAPIESSGATGVNGNQSDNSVFAAGAVYVFTRSNGVWSQQAYIKSSHPDQWDNFGGGYNGTNSGLALDGNTLVVGAVGDDSVSTGINGDPTDNGGNNNGSVYVFTRSNGVWSQQAYLKASKASAGDDFGFDVDIAGDTIVVGAGRDDGGAVGVNADEPVFVVNSGAVYVYTRTARVWTQQAYIKASNAGNHDFFGVSVAISGNTLAVGADGEDSGATGVNGDQASNSPGSTGAAYVFTRNNGTWTQQAYIKASNTNFNDGFGDALDLYGNTLVVGAPREKSAATGINGDQADNSTGSSGAAYLFTRSGSTWSQQAYLKASNSEVDDYFGRRGSIAVSGDTVVVSSFSEDSNATGINGNQADNSLFSAGAVYVYH